MLPPETIAADLRLLSEVSARLAQNLESDLATLRRPSKPSSVARQSVPLLTAVDVCGLLQVSPRTLRRLVHLGEVPKPIRLGTAPRWRRGTIDRLLAERRR